MPGPGSGVVRVIIAWAPILAVLMLGMGGCMGDSEDYSEAKKAALEEIGLAKKELKQLEQSLPSSSGFYDDDGYGEYVLNQSTIPSSVEELRDEIQNAELLLRDPSQYESVNALDVDDFLLGQVIAHSAQFREQIVELRDTLQIAETQLGQIAALENDLEALADGASSAEILREIERLQADLVALRRLYTDDEAIDGLEGKVRVDVPDVVHDALMREGKNGFMSVEDVPLEIQQAIDELRAEFTALYERAE